MSLLSASAVSSTIVSLPIVNYQYPRNIKLGAKCPAWLCTRALPSRRRGSISVSLKSRKQSALVVCSAALLRDAVQNKLKLSHVNLQLLLLHLLMARKCHQNLMMEALDFHQAMMAVAVEVAGPVDSSYSAFWPF